MSLALDLPLCPTDVTACVQCTNGVTLQDSWKTASGGRICLGCVGAQVEAHRLAAVADREIPL
jgi:hypothetical protein